MQSILFTRLRMSRALPKNYAEAAKRYCLTDAFAKLPAVPLQERKSISRRRSRALHSSSNQKPGRVSFVHMLAVKTAYEMPHWIKKNRFGFN